MNEGEIGWWLQFGVGWGEHGNERGIVIDFQSVGLLLLYLLILIKNKTIN